MSGQNRADIKIGANVNIVLKCDQRTGKLTQGTVATILTKSSCHPHRIKVKLHECFESTGTILLSFKSEILFAMPQTIPY